MRKLIIGIFILYWFFPSTRAAAAALGWHELRTDDEGRIQPWLEEDGGAPCDGTVRRLWGFWNGLGACPNGVAYGLQHRSWRPEHDTRGIGAGQISMGLSSWALLWAYGGDPAVLDALKTTADYVLRHGLSPPGSRWPNLPYPCNTEAHTGIFDGDAKAGKGFLQPDKAADFGAELLAVHGITGASRHLEAAQAIADTLARMAGPGDGERSPWPFRVHAGTGEVKDGYTANWTGALRLFDGLIRLRQGDGALYAKAREVATVWLKNHPMKTGRWGPYFDEDSGGSDTQINAESLAWYILESPEWDREWKKGARTILDRSLTAFGSTAWARYGIMALKGRAADRFPGANHTARHAAVELLYSERTGDGSRREASIRQLIWATYMVAKDGRSGCPAASGSSSSLEGSSPPSLEIRLDEGYGDLLRHFLRAMAAAPELAPADQDHILRTSTAVRSIRCTAESIAYATAGPPSRERLRVRGTPGKVTAGGAVLPHLQTPEALEKEEGWSFTPLGKEGGILDVRHDAATDVEVRARGRG